ncbi:MAG: hypothetical protein WBO37_16540 [Gammaproteobacteria bacterium]
MDAIAEQMPIDNVKSVVEVVVYVKDELGEQQRDRVVSRLKQSNVISAAEFCPLRHHLLLVKYDRDLFSSQQVLKSFTSLNLEARLVGPI